jgi:hypothetical protein
MTDDKKHQDKDAPAEAPSDAPPSDAASSIPEVEAEIVGEDEAPRPGAGFDAGEETVADEAIAGGPAPTPPKSWLTPGVILLTAFVLVAVVVVVWRLQSGGKSEVQTPPPVAEQDSAAVDGDKVEQAPDRTESEPTPPVNDGVDAEKITNDGGDIVKRAVAETVIDGSAQQTDDVSSLPLPDSEKINAQPLGEGLKDALQAPGEAPERDVETPQDAPMKFEFEDGAASVPETDTPADEPAAPLIEEAAVSPDAAPVVGADTAKIENDMGALKQAMRSQMADIAAALDAERARSAALEDEINALRRDFTAALDERDARAAAQWSSLRAELDKTYNIDGVGPAQLAAGIVALSALERAMNAGAPFVRELDLLAGIAPDAPAIRTLRRHADSGVPTLSALQESFGAAARASLAAAGVEKHGAIAARLMGLVSVRPAEPAAGDSVAAIISRAEDAVSQNDIARALDELEALPAPARDAMSAWLEQAQARAEAETAAAALGERFTIANGK